jgi:hypothetical protein
MYSPKRAKYGSCPNMAPSHNTIPHATTWFQVRRVRKPKRSFNCLTVDFEKVVHCVFQLNTFAAIVDLSRFSNSCLRLLKFSDDNNE